MIWRRAAGAPGPTQDPDGWQRRRLVFEKLDYAESALLALGPAVEVLDPEELRSRVRERAAEIAALYR